jgi:AAA+ superfamily predicted ATPase
MVNNEQGERGRKNAGSLAKEIGWFASVVNDRLYRYFQTPTIEMPEGIEISSTHQSLDFAPAIQPPDLSADGSLYAELIAHYSLTADERMLLMLALIPDVQPHLLDVFFTVNKQIGRGYTEFGGVKGARHGGFIPTIETALFIIAGNDLAHRFRVYQFFDPDHIFSTHQMLQIQVAGGDEPFFSNTISITDEYIDMLTTGHLRKPQFSTEFPAKRITTNMEWNELVVDEETAKALEELREFLKHGRTLFEEWGMYRKVKPGFKALFHGPPGTGKSLTAALLGKLFGLDVYRIDLSMVISKYIGETEKNLEKVFKKAEHKNWILFFDEADALFGKRTSISDAHDKYANQEIAYLLQRLEDYPGLVILASNMRTNVDEAFTRRLQAIIHFGKPQSRERLRLWKGAFSAASTPPDEESLAQIAKQYDLSGGAIMNVVQTASLAVISRGEQVITKDDLLKGIKKEFKKEGKTV